MATAEHPERDGLGQRTTDASTSATPPRGESDLRRSLLRQAVRDNLDTIDGRRGTAGDGRRAIRLLREQDRHARRNRLRALAVALVLAAAGAIAFALTQSPPTDAQATAASAAADSSASAAADAPRAPGASGEAAAIEDPGAAFAASTTFPAPRPIDASVFPLAVRRIMIDPGHGGVDPGTVTDLDDGTLREKDITLDIGSQLAELLRSDGFEVAMTREDDRFISLRERAQMANDARADLFVSIHVNWLNRYTVRGVETYYLGPTDDPELTALAQKENRNSGYTLADLRTLLDGLYADVRQDHSRKLARRTQRSLYAALRIDNPDLQNRGVKTAPFVVLVATEMPAILAEVACLSNRDEALLLTRPRYRRHIAEALFEGIRRYADDINPIEEQGS
ncbi:MAG: N-acetylmuramoyl-L-alanine amidase [Acidobacteriota bacterium]